MPIYEPKDQTKISEHFKQYVSVMYPGFTPDTLPPLQRQHIEQTFYSAWGQCLLCIRDGIGNLPPFEVAEILEGMVKQVTQFLEAEVRKTEQRGY